MNFNLILVPVPLFVIHLFLHLSLLPVLIHRSVQLFIHNSLSLSLLAYLPVSQNLFPARVVSLLLTGLPSWTVARIVSSELLGFCF